ncbi:MAG: transposase [Comamonadaceae bacterium CG2_30_60_41]|nr:MAG: transposase [Comamonadaceae bacterium CG2_30_60_41]PIW08141.1 MAG: transposase [Comamonadaceae bacterium CG17_big_fil_post_rev_8_21_14_2_50_60_13]
MPRQPRLHLDGVPLHVVQRGHNRQPCFYAEADYRAYLDWLGDAAQRTGCQIHAYALMTNHVHLLLTPLDAQAASRLMVSLGRRYVPYFNALYQRSGTLWEGRYKSSLVQSEAYLMACMRYIELNPVRAGLCADPAQYRWTSYRANALGVADPLLTPHPLYATLGADPQSRSTSYRALFDAALPDQTISDIRLALKQTQPLGNSRFLDVIAQATGQRREPKPRGRPRKPVLEEHSDNSSLAPLNKIN